MRIEYKKRALSDLQSIENYIARDDAVAAERVLRRIDRAIQRLLIIPLSGRRGPVPGTRILVVPGLPYVAIYRVRGEMIEILAVMHAARRR